MPETDDAKKTKSNASKNEKSNFIKIFLVLKQHPGGLWIRELARRSSLHMEVVRRLISRHPSVFQNYADFTGYNINLKIIKLKNPQMSPSAIDNYLRLRASEAS